jgi:hypothetical protein
MAAQVLELGWLKEQIEGAKKDIAKWPNWMKEARSESGQPAINTSASDNSER